MFNTSYLLKPLSLSIGVALLASGLSVTAYAKPATISQVPTSRISATVLQQIQALQNQKASLTESQRKVDLHLRHAQEQQSNAIASADAIAAQVPKLRSMVEIYADGTVPVDIKATVSTQLLAQITAQGGTILSSVPEYNAIRARVPLNQIDSLAVSADVQAIRPAVRAMTNKLNTSEGDNAHHTLSARQSCGVDGSGIKIGVISDSVDYLSQVQASGDLPYVTVLEDAPGSSGEGTALLEIVHDIAPAAELYFATAWLGKANFAYNIKALRDAGVDIIVDDVFYFDESPFQDDIISQAVNEVTADGVLYFSSAGNSGNFNDNESGVWEGDFNGVAHPDWGIVHNFGNGDVTNNVLEMAPFAVTLFWSDPLGASANDYDLVLLDPTGTWVVDISANWQTGSEDPFEMMGYALPGEQIVVVKYTGEDRYLHLNTLRGRLEYGTDGQIAGHAAAENAFAVAAVDARGNPSTVFEGAEPIEWFSSDGPRRVFYEADGTPITPGNVSATGGKVRAKPDLAAADGVTVATPGFDPFYGTSAAAPHAAAIAGLLWSANPSLSPAQIRTKLTQTALDIEAPGWDRDSGAGLIMAHDCSIYGVNDKGLNNSQHFAVHPYANFTVNAVGPQYKAHDIEGLDIHPVTGALYVTSGDDSKRGHLPGHLYQVNKFNGKLTAIGSTGFNEVSALSFRPENDNSQFTLWGWAEGDGLIQINPTTGASTLIAATPLAIEDITWSNDGQLLYGVEDSVLYQYDSTIGAITIACHNFPAEVEALDMLPDGNLLIAFHEANDSSIHSFNIDSCSIDVSVDLPPAANSPINTPYRDIEGLAWYHWASKVQ